MREAEAEEAEAEAEDAGGSLFGAADGAGSAAARSSACSAARRATTPFRTARGTFGVGADLLRDFGGGRTGTSLRGHGGAAAVEEEVGEEVRGATSPSNRGASFARTSSQALLLLSAASLACSGAPSS